MEEKAGLTSIKVFRSFIVQENGKLSAEGITSRECFELWLRSRKQPPKRPEKAFQRALSAHLCGVDGRHPFNPLEEQAILSVIRRKAKWPCFADAKIRFGETGFRAKGFHEKTSQNNNRSSSYVPQGGVMAQDTLPRHPFIQHEEDELINQSLKRPEDARNEQIDKISKRSRTSPIDERERHGHMFWFYGQCVDILSKFRFSKSDAWLRILQFTRMLLFAFGFFNDPNRESVIEAAYKEHCKQFPNQAVLVVDLLCNEVKDRFAFMNEQAEGVFGKIGRKHGGTTRKLFHAADEMTSLKNAITAWQTEEIVSWTVHLYRNDALELRPYRVFVKANRALKIYITFGYFPVDEDDRYVRELQVPTMIGVEDENLTEETASLEEKLSLPEL